MKLIELDITQDIIDRALVNVQKGDKIRARCCVVATAIKEQLNMNSVSVGSGMLVHACVRNSPNRALYKLTRDAEKVRNQFDFSPSTLKPCKIKVYEMKASRI